MKLAILAALTLMTVTGHADETALRVPITRAGVTTTRVAYQFWSGEYPGPILDVGGSNKGTTTIKAYRSLRKLESPVKCEIKNGLVHPWSEEKTSVVDYYTLTAISTYRAQNAVTIETSDDKLPTVTLAKGDQITNVVYYGENQCGARLEQANAKAKDIVVGCDVLENADLKQVTAKDEFQEQWIRVKCADGTKAFIQDKALAGTKGVVDGDLVEYGKVGRAPKK